MPLYTIKKTTCSLCINDYLVFKSKIGKIGVADKDKLKIYTDLYSPRKERICFVFISSCCNDGISVCKKHLEKIMGEINGTL
jgi:hypothetical protein